MTSPQPDYRFPPGPTEPIALGIDADDASVLQRLQAEYGDMVSMKKPNGRLAYFR